MVTNPTTKETHRKGANKRGEKASPWESFMVEILRKLISNAKKKLVYYRN